MDHTLHIQTQPLLKHAFSALADSMRQAILRRFALGEAALNELAAPLPVSQPAVSLHLKVLESAELIERQVDGIGCPSRLAAQGIESMDA